jgi:uncharacterized protein YcbK (DUF882 family)
MISGWHSKYFKRSEFACRCGCGDAQINKALLPILDNVREYFNTPVIINSGKRCKKHNKAVGGAMYSKHLTGEAADIVVKGVPASTVYEYLDTKYPNALGLGKYSTFTHIDVRRSKSRW